MLENTEVGRSAGLKLPAGIKELHANYTGSMLTVMANNTGNSALNAGS